MVLDCFLLSTRKLELIDRVIDARKLMFAELSTHRPIMFRVYSLSMVGESKMTVHSVD